MSSDSDFLEETHRRSETQYPHKQPKSDSDYLEFFDSLFSTDLTQVDQQELKAFCFVLQSPPDSIKPIFTNDPRLFNLLHCCISRADTTFQELLLFYTDPHSPFFTSLIPTLIWVFISQKSKRFVEPFLVQYFEQTRTSTAEFCARILNGFEIPRLVHKPISNEEKNFVVLCYFLWFLQELERVNGEAIRIFLGLCRRMVCGVENPHPDVGMVVEGDGEQVGMQYSLRGELLTVVLLIISQIKRERKEKKRTLKEILEYTQKEVLPGGIFLAKYLLENLG